MIRFGILFFVTIGLGACSSAMDYTSSIGEREALRIGHKVTPKSERKRLIRMLTRANDTHRADALREIEAR